MAWVKVPPENHPKSGPKRTPIDGRIIAGFSATAKGLPASLVRKLVKARIAEGTKKKPALKRA